MPLGNVAHRNAALLRRLVLARALQRYGRGAAMPDAQDPTLRALDAGILALMHQLDRDLAAVERTHGGAAETLRARWTATELVALALHAATVRAATGPAQP